MNTTKKGRKLPLFGMLFFLCLASLGLYYGSTKVSAYEAQDGTVKGSDVRVRKTPVSGEVICKLGSGYTVTVTDESGGTDGYTWYQISFTFDDVQQSGWIRSDFIKLKTAQTADTDEGFEAALEAEGFPESYRVLLRVLHQEHPEWEFKALHTNLEWSAVVGGQTSVVYRNLVPATSISSYKSLESGAYDWDSNKWYEYEKGWVAASTEIIQYYMDPRNFLVDDATILQFQSLRWTGLETKGGVSNILSGTTMGSSGEDFAGYFVNAGQKNNISAYHLSSRAVQETAGGSSGSVTGTYKNYFNIGATGSDPVAAAVNYAKLQGWNSSESSISGGAVIIANSYVNRGQDTLYLQKFDVVDGGDGFYAHQYMQNLMAPASESKQIAKAYGNLDGTAVAFTIPVYRNMPSSPCILPQTDGNPNNLLNSLSVDGYSLTPGFNKFKYNYDVIVAEGTESVTINAAPVLSGTKVTGTGTVALTEDVTTVTVTATPGYGTPRDYRITIAKSGAGNTTPPEEPNGGSNGEGSGQTTPTEAGDLTTSYRLQDDKTMTGIAAGSQADQVIANISVANRSVAVVSADGSQKTGTVGTGDRIQILNGQSVEEEFTVLIYGDVSGDGAINFSDLLIAQRHLVEITEATGIYAAALDINQDGVINFTDILNLQRHIVGIKSISQ